MSRSASLKTLSVIKIIKKIENSTLKGLHCRHHILERSDLKEYIFKTMLRKHHFWKIIFEKVTTFFWVMFWFLSCYLSLQHTLSQTVTMLHTIKLCHKSRIYLQVRVRNTSLSRHISIGYRTSVWRHYSRLGVVLIRGEKQMNSSTPWNDILHFHPQSAQTQDKNKS